MTNKIKIKTFDLERSAPQKVAKALDGGDQQGKAAAHEAEIPFIKRIPLGGWGPFFWVHDRLAISEDTLSGTRLPLKIKTIVIEDPTGTRVALVTADLHGGCRYTTEKVGEQLHSEGFGPHNIVFSGTHCHSGPGGLNASPYYDSLAASIGLHGGDLDKRLGFARDLADEISNLVAASIRTCLAQLSAAKLGWFVGRIDPRYITNRSLASFTANGRELLAQLRSSKTGAVAFGEHNVDTRIPTLVVTNPDGTRVLATYSTFSAHNALLDREHDIWSPDIFGHAAHKVSRRLAGTGIEKAVVAVAAGAIGDCDPALPNVALARLLRERRVLESNKKHIAEYSSELAVALSAAILGAQSAAHSISKISVRSHEIDVSSPLDCAGLLMPARARVGASTVAGSELGTGNMGPIRFAETDGRTAKMPTGNDPHWPKRYEPLEIDLATEGTPLETANKYLGYQHKKLGMRFIEIELMGFMPVRLITVPGEPTTMLSHQLTLAALTGAPSNTLAMVVAVAGDYCGYLTTEREYDEQQYEGSSTIWGRNTGALLARWALKLATESQYEAPWTGTATFFTEEESYSSNIYSFGQRRAGLWWRTKRTEAEVKTALMDELESNH